MSKRIGLDEFRKEIAGVLEVSVEEVSANATFDSLKFTGFDLLQLSYRLGFPIGDYTSGGNLTDNGREFIKSIADAAQDEAEHLYRLNEGRDCVTIKATRQSLSRIAPLLENTDRFSGLTVDDAWNLYSIITDSMVAS